jgi:hypothetical protein
VNRRDWVSVAVNRVGSLRFNLRLTHCVALIGVHGIEITTSGVYVHSQMLRQPLESQMWYVGDAELYTIWGRVGDAFDREKLKMSTFLELLILGHTGQFTCSSFCWWLLTGETRYGLCTPRRLYNHVQREIFGA